MADEIVIETTSTEVVEVGVVGPQGPQGPKGDPGDVAGLPLSAQGDTLYRGASQNERLAIGSTGQVLKVSAQGLPSWQNESGAVTSVNGATGAVTVAAATHATRHEAGNEDELQATAALVATDVVALNGVYFWDGTTTSGRPNFFKTGTRKNTKIVYNSGTNQWNLVRNLTVEAVGVDGPDTVPWGNTWEDFVTPTTVSVTRLPLETMVQRLAETGSASTATTSEDGLMSSSDKTKLNGIAAGAEVNVQANWTEADTASDAFILNKPSTFAPSAHSSSHASSGSDPLAPSDIGAAASNHTHILATDIATALAEDPDLCRESLNLGDMATEPSSNFSQSSHTHGNLTNDGKLGSDSGRVLVTTTAGAVTTLALGTAGQVLTVNSGATGVEFAAASGGGVTGAASSASDVLGVSGANITGVDAGSADRLVFWDDSASKLTYLEAGSGLSISGTTISATASGGSKTYAVFTAEHNQPPSTAFATLDTRNSIAVLDFDDATDESAVFVSIIPEGASLGSGLKIRLHWMATTATSGNAVWDVSLERMTTDLDSDSFDTIASGTAAANGTSGILTVTEITLTTIDSVTAGDGFRLKVTRDANNASDTMTGDAELVVCEVRSAA